MSDLQIVTGFVAAGLPFGFIIINLIGLYERWEIKRDEKKQKRAHE